MKVAVIGTGYVGLVTGTCLAEHGHNVICVDKISDKIEALRQGIIPIYEPGLKELVDRNAAAGRLCFSTDTAEGVGTSDVVFIAVGTPPGPAGEADLTFVKEVAHEIGESMRGYRVVVNKSTVPVGTADLVAGILAAHTPYPFDVVSNPEFLREGAAVEDCMHPDRIVIGSRNTRATAIMRKLYQSFEAPLVVTDPRSAEMIKYAANAFLSVKISFVNEVAGLCERLGADIQEVARGIGLDRRIGQAFLKAGIGYGGSCFPKDTQALVNMARRTEYELPIVQAAIEVNHNQRVSVASRVERALGGFQGRTVGLLGVAFKPHTDDVREAPALDLARLIVNAGGRVKAYDPKAMQNASSELEDLGDMVAFCSTAIEVVEDVDALVLVTEWPEFATLPWDTVFSKVRLPNLFDARNFLDPDEMRRIGFSYSGIGRGVPDLNLVAH